MRLNQKTVQRNVGTLILKLLPSTDQKLLPGPSTTTKSKKDGSKQTTLFGMLPKADKVPRPKKNATSKEGTPAESVQDTQAESQVDTQMESQLDSQMTDVTMTDLETQDAQDTQTTAADKSSDWEETQLVDPLEA